MKRIFTLIAVISVFLGAMAQRPLVTLSHDGNLTFFSNLSALEDAIEAAQDGDIIYLSEGKFTSSSDYITIYKMISFVGCGYNSHILPSIEVYTHGRDTLTEHTWFDGVRLQYLRFTTSVNYNIDNIHATIKNTWIGTLDCGGYAGHNNLYDKCLIEYADFSGENDHDTFIQNTKIGYIKDGGSSLEVKNCNIRNTDYCPRVVRSSIISGGGWYDYLLANGTHIIYNSWLPSRIIVFNEISTSNCYFNEEGGTLLDDNLEATVDLKEMGYLGEDGTVVGVYGGVSPYTVYPSVPTVDSANSSVEYDVENNKLNVTISVAPR